MLVLGPSGTITQVAGPEYCQLSEDRLSCLAAGGILSLPLLVRSRDFNLSPNNKALFGKLGGHQRSLLRTYFDDPM